jgi:predicted DNA-binding transcriptional regulator AlpA
MPVVVKGKTYLTITEVSHKFGVSPKTVYRWINSGVVLPPPRIKQGYRSTIYVTDDWIADTMERLSERESGRKKVVGVEAIEQEEYVYRDNFISPGSREDLDMFENVPFHVAVARRSQYIHQLGELDEFVTVIFDDAAQFVRLVTYVYERFDGKGLELSDAPIVTSVCIRPSLIRQLPQELTNGMRIVTNQDVSGALAQYERDEALGIQEAFERFPFVETSLKQKSSQE